MAQECPLNKMQERRPYHPFQKNAPQKSGFKKKPFDKPRQQGFRKRNKFPGPKPFQARAAHIEEMDLDEEQYYQQPEEQEDTADLAVRTLRLPDEKKEKFFAELRELDINF